MQPCEFVLIKDLELREAIKRIVDDYRLSDFFPLEATREEWQGSPWTPEGGEFRTALAPVFILLLGDTRRIVGLPMAARYSRQKGDSIFESSMAFPFMYMLLAAETLGLAAMPVSATKYPKVGGLDQAPAQHPRLHEDLRHAPGGRERDGRRPGSEAHACTWTRWSITTGPPTTSS